MFCKHTILVWNSIAGGRKARTVNITEVGVFETLTYPPTKNFNSERNNRTGTRHQFLLYCVIGRLFLPYGNF